ncbi:alpha/beta fold hydrolase [Amycolatopsis anabasis]|uniref:alpha/beta fold hydrolase n=1 Tax=Amycolatopsis anabasis TaxID=1840409 RepID=UPI00131B6171|nr:alpha/beta fold hydrolase [Amycolatopsis anabasis]
MAIESTSLSWGPVVKKVVAVLTALVTAVSVATAGPAAADQPAPGGVPGVRVPVLEWTDCGDGVQCATATVPLDYRDPAGRTIALAVYRKPAADPGQRIGSLFVNPGGPGGTTRNMVRSYGTTGPAELRTRFDIVSFDPRGVGGSSPLRCQTPEEYSAAWTRATGRPAEGGFERAVEQAAALDRACAERSGALLPFVGAENFARDLDVLRAAVGDAKLSYLGISYGTFLGTVYANLFGKNVRVLSLDGAYDPQHYTNRPYDYDAPQFRAADSALMRFFGWCVKTPGLCSFGDGNPAAAFVSLQRDLDANPVRDANGQVIANGATLALQVVFRLNSGKSGWVALGAALADAARNRTGSLVAPIATGMPDFLNANTAIECSERRFPEDLGVLRARLHAEAASAPLLGPALAYGPPSYDHAHAPACVQWPIERRSRYAGPWNAPSAPPILVTGTTGDPDTPFGDAITLSRTFDRARLLVFDGEGHSAMRRSACATAVETRYLVDRILPEPGTVCADEPVPVA